MTTGCNRTLLWLLAWPLLAQPPAPAPNPAATPKPAAAPKSAAAPKPVTAKPAKPKPPENPAHELVRQGLRAMGGEEALRAVKTVRWESAGHRYLIEQSERPEGPWVVSYQRGSVLMEPALLRMRGTVEERMFELADPKPVTFVVNETAAAFVDGDNFQPANITLLADAKERMEFGPERILLAALEAEDLKLEGEETFQGAPHRRLTFTKRKLQVSLLLNAQSRLPAAVEYVSARPADYFWGPWGDIRIRQRYGLWAMEPGGVVLPRLRVEERNGLPYLSMTALKLEINPETGASDFTIPPAVRQMFTLGILQSIETVPLGVQGAPVREFGPGFYVVPGRVSISIVRQDDGVVVLEAPISSGYSRKAMEEAGWRARNAPLKAVILSGDGWPLVGGVREYVAAGVPVYALGLNKAVLERITAAPHSILPDTLQKTPRPAQWNWVTGKTTIGKGANELELYPLGGAGSERALMVYFPASKLLYAGQYFARRADGALFMPSYAAEVIAAVEREKLKVSTIYGAQTYPVTWAAFVALYEKARAGTPPAKPPEPAPAKAKN